MKNLAIIIVLISGIVLFDACKKVETDPKIDFSSTSAPSITSPAEGADIILTEDMADEMLTFSWNAVSYSVPAELAYPTYSLMLVFAEGSFDDAVELASTVETTYEVTYASMNNTLVAMGVSPNTKTAMKLMVSASLKSYDDGKVIAASVSDSPELSMSVTPYETASVEYPKLWVPGAYQGWAPDQAPFVQSFEDDGIYTGYLYFQADAESFEFKFTSEPSWDGTNYGQGENDGELSTDGGAGNLSVPGPGGYMVTVNTNDLTWTYELQEWGIIGEFNGWSEQVNMSWDTENRILTLTYDVPAADNNRFKFRANDNWDINLGAIDPPDGSTLTWGGGDIPIESGNYTFHLDLNSKAYKYEVIPN
jgi:starch-binding outer membrane protein SusE/F